MIRVLIVDDEHQLVEAFKKKLAKEGFQVFTALNGREAISIMKDNELDIGLFDIKLPDMDGVELLGKLREMQPTSEVVMLTGYASVDTAIRSMKLGAYDYLTKPCKLSELHNVILKAYEKKQLKEKTIVLAEQLQRVELTRQFYRREQRGQRGQEVCFHGEYFRCTRSGPRRDRHRERACGKGYSWAIEAFREPFCGH